MKNCNYDDGEHEFVGLDMCIYCGECKQLLLQSEFFKGADGEMHPKKGIRKTQSTSPEPCDACKKKFEEQGLVPMIEAERGPKGPIFGRRYILVNRAAIHGEEFIKFMDTHGFLICDIETMDKLIKDREDYENANR